MSIELLPNEILSLIFKKLSLQQQIRLRGVNLRWLAVVEEMCLQPRRTLKIFDCREDIEHYCSKLINLSPDELPYWSLKPEPEDDDLLIDYRHFTPECIDFISHLFPSLQTLIVSKMDFFKTSEYYENLHLLVAKYRESLINLSIVGQYFDTEHIEDDQSGEEVPGGGDSENDAEPELIREVEQDDDDVDEEASYENDSQPTRASQQIAAAINSLQRLTRLDINVTNLAFRLAPALEPALLARLERFELYDSRYDEYDHENRLSFAENFTSLGPNCARLHLHLVDIVGQDAVIGSTLPCPNLSAHLLHLNTSCPQDHDYFRIICRQLSALESLNIDLQHMFYLGEDLLCELSRLKNLKDLCLDELQYMKHFFVLPSSPMHPLRSMKRLSLHQLEYLDRDIETNERIEFDGRHFCETLVAWFPNLESLTINADEAVLQVIAANREHLPEALQCRLLTLEDRERELDKHTGRHNIRIENY